MANKNALSPNDCSKGTGPLLRNSDVPTERMVSMVGSEMAESLVEEVPSFLCVVRQFRGCPNENESFGDGTGTPALFRISKKLGIPCIEFTSTLALPVAGAKAVVDIKLKWIVDKVIATSAARAAGVVGDRRSMIKLVGWILCYLPKIRNVQYLLPLNVASKGDLWAL